MSDCWVCKQKADWKQQKLNAARADAIYQANEKAETMAIIKEGCNFRIIPAADIPPGTIPFEYISKYQQPAT